MVICYIYFLEHYEEYQLAFGNAGVLALPVFGKIWEKGTCGTHLVHKVYHFGEALAQWILNLTYNFQKSHLVWGLVPTFLFEESAQVA